MNSLSVECELSVNSEMILLFFLFFCHLVERERRGEWSRGSWLGVEQRDVGRYF